MTRGFKWVEWKMTDPEENLKILSDLHREYLVTYIVGQYSHVRTTNNSPFARNP